MKEWWKSVNRRWRIVTYVVVAIVLIAIWPVTLTALAIWLVTWGIIKIVQAQSRRDKATLAQVEAEARAQVSKQALLTLQQNSTKASAMIRVTDVDRDAVVTQLTAARVSGALDVVEFDDRMSSAMASKTRRDLGGLLVDLP